MKFILIPFSLFVLFSNILSAQLTGNITYSENARWKFQNETLIQHAAIRNMNELTLEVNALYNAQTSSYLAIFHVVQAGSSARECDSLINLRISNFRTAALKGGINPSDFVTDMLSMVPLYEIEIIKKRFSKTYNEVPAGFEIQKNVHIRFEDAAILDQLITAAAFEEIFDLVKVEYFVEDVSAIYDSLRLEATAVIKKRVAQFEELGVKLKGQWIMASDQQGVFYPVDRYTSYTSKSRPSLKSAKKEINIEEIQPSQTLFYNKVPYTGYDIVFHPQMTEPAVQYTYSLQVKFEVLKEEQKTKPVEKIVNKNHYFLVTPEGKINELPTP